MFLIRILKTGLSVPLNVPARSLYVQQVQGGFFIPEALYADKHPVELQSSYDGESNIQYWAENFQSWNPLQKYKVNLGELNN